MTRKAKRNNKPQGKRGAFPKPKIPALRQGDRVELRWIDSGTLVADDNLEEAILHRPWDIGYYVDTTEDTIRICMEKDWRGGKFWPDTIGVFWLTAVKEVHKLRR